VTEAVTAQVVANIACGKRMARRGHTHPRRSSRTGAKQEQYNEAT